ncbi:MAG: hypothetical protein E7009_02525 [Alphaproteobacteria bacterium]|nr:hypothetical protein [Alphaproteobacteria bacterium]
MKKQPKATKKAQYCITHTPAQRFWGIMAFAALFICGVMVGMGLNNNPHYGKNVAHASENPAPTETATVDSGKQTCTLIEESLLVRLPEGDEFASSYDRIERAKIYANLSERGCAENAQKYHDLAKQELAIARALQDDEFSQTDTIEVVETYKRLNMQAAAEEIFETAKKLTNPTIDFILAVEQIINEQ